MPGLGKRTGRLLVGLTADTGKQSLEDQGMLMGTGRRAGTFRSLKDHSMLMGMGKYASIQGMMMGMRRRAGHFRSLEDQSMLMGMGKRSPYQSLEDQGMLMGMGKRGVPSLLTMLMGKLMGKLADHPHGEDP